MKKEIVKSVLIINRIALFAILAFSLFYSIFITKFAHLHINLNILNFPVFVGELLLAGCLVLLILKFKIGKHEFTKWDKLLCLYFYWVLMKALMGYFTWGPLAFRNAALFYYPMFAVFGYYFFDSTIFTKKMRAFLLCLILGIFLLVSLDHYYWLPYVLTAAVFIMILKNGLIKKLLMFLLGVIVLFSPSYFFMGSRSHSVGLTITGIFLIIYYTNNYLFRYKKWQRRLSLFILLSVMVFLIFHRADQGALKSVLTPGHVIQEFKRLDKKIQKKEESFVLVKRKARLYRDNVYDDPIYVRGGAIVSKEIAGIFQNVKIEHGKAAQFNTLNNTEYSSEDDFQGDGNAGFNLGASLNDKLDSDELAGSKTRLIENAYVTMLFRLFIWRDMIREMIRETAFLGINFGKPQRSKSIEILGWARDEWTIDGWITPHNFFIHLIYRSGLVGVIIIAVLFWLLYLIVKRFIEYRSLLGGALVGVLIYWITISTFLVFLEFPYGAIPFWSLLGMVLAYSHSLTQGKKDENPHYT